LLAVDRLQIVFVSKIINTYPFCAACEPRSYIQQSSVVILGNKEVWRIDPTGQFLNCHAVAIGYGSDKAQVELFQQVIRRSKENHNCEQFFANLGLEEAIEIACECIEQTIFPKGQDGQGSPTRSLSIPWYGLVMDYSGVTTSNRVPKRKILRGKFSPAVVQNS
jgi:20S proteasome alpha/beta subunit